MTQKKLDMLIDKYLALFPRRKVSEENLKYIENKLGIVLPEDFKAVANVYDGYEELAGQSLFSFDPNIEDWNVVSKTLFYRESDCKLPTRYLALREESENFVVLETQPIVTEPARVVWCSLTDAYNLEDMSKMVDNPIIFPSFADYFDYLIKEEEQIRKEY